MGRKIVWIGNAISDFISWIGTAISKIFGSPIQHAAVKSVLPLIDNPLKAGDKIDVYHLDDCAIWNNQDVIFKKGDLITFPRGFGEYTYQVYAIDSINSKGDIVFKLDQ